MLGLEEIAPHTANRKTLRGPWKHCLERKGFKQYSAFLGLLNSLRERAQTISKAMRSVGESKVVHVISYKRLIKTSVNSKLIALIIPTAFSNNMFNSICHLQARLETTILRSLTASLIWDWNSGSQEISFEAAKV